MTSGAAHEAIFKLMMVRPATRETEMVDLLDRILDKGMVMDAWARVVLVGIDLITVEARVVVASIDTYRKHARPIGLLDSLWPQPPVLKEKARAVRRRNLALNPG